MVKGAFRRMTHDHDFTDQPQGTLMTDRFDFASPFGPLGAMVDRVFLAGYLRRFIVQRNAILKRVAESEEWRRYLEKKNA
jgi:ligand-binding SRPBCC domain-containing protein